MPYWSWARTNADSKISSTIDWICSSSEQCSKTLYHKSNIKNSIPRYNTVWLEPLQPAKCSIYLNDTATIRMGRKWGDLTSKSRNNKSNFLCRDTFYAFLYNMISILITYTFHNMSIKLMHKLYFLIKLNNFKGLNKNPAQDQESMRMLLKWRQFYSRIGEGHSP